MNKKISDLLMRGYCKDCKEEFALQTIAEPRRCITCYCKKNYSQPCRDLMESEAARERLRKSLEDNK